MATWTWEVFDPETEEILEFGEIAADSEDEAREHINADYSPEVPDGMELRVYQFVEDDSY
jgi:hypothetical protein